MGRRKKKRNQNKNKKSQNTHNGKTHSKKIDILNTIQQAQDITSAQLNQAHEENRNHNRKNNNHKNRKNNRKYGKNKWKQKGESYDYKSEINQFLDQLRPSNLGIRNARSDGNCLFRAIADQLDGDENNHKQCRKNIIQYMTEHHEEFAPFYVGDYDAYLKKMSKNGIWGGNMELTAAAKAFKVDIVIHALHAARYEILYQKGKPNRTIHLSYHNERHYASVRQIDDMQGNKPAKVINLDKTHNDLLQREQQRAEIAWCHNGGNPLDIESARDELMDLTTNEQIVVARTGCYDIQKVKNALKFLDGDINAAVENIMVDMSLMANEHKEKVAEELKTQKEEEKKKKQNKKNKKKKKKKGKATEPTQKVEKEEEEKKTDPDPITVVANNSGSNDSTANDIAMNTKADDIVSKNKINDVQVYAEIVEEKKDGKISATSKIKCIRCEFEHAVLFTYLNHYRLVHLQRGTITEKKKSESVTDCMCGHQNQSDFKFCSDCGWDLRFKPIIPTDVKQTIVKQKEDEKAKQNAAIERKECNMNEAIKEVHESTVVKEVHLDNVSNTIHVADVYGVHKYKKYLNRYWICKQCSFWNCDTNTRCMVCSMSQIAKRNACVVQKVEKKMKVNTEQAVIKPNWVSMVIQKKTKASKPKAAPQQKKNPFAWICTRCTLENKPAQQKCKTCGNPKPKKEKKKKKKKKDKNTNGWKCSCTLINDPKAKRCAVCNKKRNKAESKTAVYYADPQYDCDEDEVKQEIDSYDKTWEQYKNKEKQYQDVDVDECDNEDDDDDNQNNKWNPSGNMKCSCGSGKKYKKCCKKLEKHQDKTCTNKFKNVECDVVDEIDDTMDLNKLDDVIHMLQCQISNFKGKTKSQLMRELAKLKAQRRELKSNKNRSNKSQNKRNRCKKGENQEHKANVTMASNVNGAISAAANKTIAI